MFIRATCFTNIDKFKTVKWPTAFVDIPRVGDYVEGRREGSGPRARPRLRVVSITHMMECITNWGSKLEPAVRIELHN